MITEEQLAVLLDMRFSIRDIASMLRVSPIELSEEESFIMAWMRKLRTVKSVTRLLITLRSSLLIHTLTQKIARLLCFSCGLLRNLTGGTHFRSSCAAHLLHNIDIYTAIQITFNMITAIQHFSLMF